MVYKIQCAVLLIVLSTRMCYSTSCLGNPRTLIRAADIQSHILNGYLSSWDCKSDYGYVSWFTYVTKCFQNTTCVGIQSTDPPTMCTLSSISGNGPVQTEDLWLINSELARFEGEP